MTAEGASATIGIYVRTLRRCWPLALAIVSATLLAGVLVTAQLPRRYDATAKIVLGQQQQVDAVLGTEQSSSDPERDLNTSVQLIGLESVADHVRAQLRTDETAQALLAQLTTAVDSNSNLVSITARDADPARAARIANAFAASYKEFRARAAQAAVDDAVAAAQARLATLPAGAERDALARQLRRLQVAAAFQTGGVQIVRPAAPPTTPSRPRPKLSAFVAGFLGLLLAGAAIIVLARTDRRLRDEGDVERIVGRPVLATIPAGRGRERRESAREALVTLGMRLAHATRRPSIILITSPGPDEGAPEVTLGLAAALATLGRRTIAIEADLRRPTFAERLGAPGRGGLSALIRGGGRLAQEVIELERSFDGEVAQVLPAGAARARPQMLLASLSMQAVLVETRARADVVLVCAPPAGKFGDALTLAPLADAALLVARMDATDADEARRARESLEEVGTQVVGVAAIVGRRGAGVSVGEAAPAAARAHSAGARELAGPATAPEALA